MTSGERMVWAHAFVLARSEAWSVSESARSAAVFVRSLREVDRSQLDDDARAMLDDMLSTGADR